MKFSDAFENIGIKLVCLLLAIVVWLYASRVPQIPKPGERSSITNNVELPEGMSFVRAEPQEISF